MRLVECGAMGLPFAIYQRQGRRSAFVKPTERRVIQQAAVAS
jgi:hypothetical protein